jgi:hypothetical protein
MEVENPIWNIFMLATSFKSPLILNYSKDSRKTDLKELWSDRQIEILISNAPELHFGQGLLHGDLHRLYYDLGDKYTLTLKIKEDIEFQRGINVKLKPGKFPKSATELISSV